MIPQGDFPTTVNCLPSQAGKPYIPSNGTEGSVFEGAFCDRCSKCDVDSACPISTLAFWSGEAPPEWVRTDEGWPVCTAFDKVGPPEGLMAYAEFAAKDNHIVFDPNQLSLEDTDSTSYMVYPGTTRIDRGCLRCGIIVTEVITDLRRPIWVRRDETSKR